MGLELSGVIDPDLNWTTAAKGRRNTVRRARTSFIGDCTVKTPISSKDISVKENMVDVSISESEKVGVSILGQRFSESLKNFPIKKRRRLLAYSPSHPPPSYQLDFSDDFLTSQMVSSQGISAYVKQDKRRPTSRKKYSFKDNDEACGTADFSGISILAAAACNSNIVGDIINAGGFNPNDNSSMREVLSNAERSEPVALCEEKIQHMRITEGLDRECSLPAEMCSSTSSVKAFDVDELPSSKSSVGPLQDVSDKMKSSFCNPKFHWDLNTVMDAWDNSCGDILNCQPLTTDHRVESSQSERHSILDTSKSKLQTDFVSEFDDHIVDVVGSQKDDCVSLKAENGKEHYMSNVKSSDSGEAKQFSVCGVYGNDEMEQRFDVHSASLVGSNVETTSVNGQEIYTCSAENISHADEAFIKYSCVVKSIEKLKSDEVNKSVETEPMSNVVFRENLSCHSTTHKPYCNLRESTKDEDSNENADDNESTRKSIVQSDPNELCLIDSEVQHFNSDNIDDYPSTNHLNDIASKEPIDENVCGDKNTTYDISGVVHSDESISEASKEPCLPRTRCRGTIESSDNEILPSQTTHDDKHETSTVDQNVVDMRYATFSDVNLVSIRSDHNGYDSLTASIPIPPVTPLKVDSDMVDDVVRTVESKCYLANYTNSCKGCGLSDNLGCTSETKSANEDGNQTNGMEKIHFLEDESQYEDGEVRDHVLHGWGDAAEEVEAEHLDCGSNAKEIDFEPPSHPPVCLPADDMACKDMHFTACDGAHSGKGMDLAISQPLLKCSSFPDPSDVEYCNNGTVTSHVDYSGLNSGRKSQKFVKYASLSTDNVAGYISDDRDRESSASTRLKMSGWDQMPESRRHNREKVSDKGTSGMKYHSEGSFAVVAAGGLLRSSSSFRDLTSRVERSSSSDEPRRSHIEESRFHESIDVDVKAGADIGSPNPRGSYGSSCHTQGRERDEQWLEPSNHYVLRNRDSSAYYAIPSYAQLGSMNAAAAAVAKVENDGFVVAPDGTLVKAGGVGSSGQLLRRSANGRLHASRRPISGSGSLCERNHTCDMWGRLPRSREMSSHKHFIDEHDRVGRYNHEMVRNQYHRPVPDDDIQSGLLHMSRRNRSFSPHRGNPRISSSHSRSSRLRTSSPSNWTSSKESGRVRMNGDSNLRRRSKSPLVFNSDARMKTRSPHQRPNYGDHTVAYGPRINASLPHALRDSRKGSPDHFRELDYRKNSGNSATTSILRHKRFNDSHGRSKHDDYCRPLPSRRVPDLADFGRGFGHDGIRDRRGHADGYELPHLTSKHDMNAKHAHRDVKESFQNNSTGFRQMGSPKNFIRRTCSHVGDSPDKVNEKEPC